MSCGESIELDHSWVSDHFVCESLHPLEEVLVGFSLLAWHFLVENLPQFLQNGPFDDLRQFIYIFRTAKANLSHEQLVLFSVHLELKLFFGVCVWILGDFPFDFMSFAHN